MLTVLARLVEIQMWYHLHLQGEDSAKEQWLLPTLLFGRRLPVNPLFPARQFNFSLYIPGTSAAAAPVLELRVSAFE